MFDSVFCINLDRRTDRWKDFSERYAACRWPLNPVERLAAVDGKDHSPDRPWIASEGAWGCFQSHLNAWKLAKSRGHKSILVFEDDSIIPADFDVKFLEYWNAVPSDWLGVHLESHGSRIKKSNILPNQKAIRAYCIMATCCYALREPLLSLVIDAERYNNTHVDQYLNDFQMRMPWYAPNVGFAPVTHGRSKSDINWATSQ